MKSKLLIVLGCLAVAGVPAAFAQGAAPRQPAGGLFGATRTDVAGRDKLNFTFQLAEGFDSELPPDVSSRISRGLDSGGWSTILQASSDYSRSGRRVQLTGDASTAVRYYQSLDRVEPVSHNAAVGASVKILNGSIRFQQMAEYSPSYFYQLFPTSSGSELGDVIPASPDFRLEETESYSYTSDLRMNFGSPRGTQVTATGGFTRTDYSEQARFRDMEVYDGSLEVSRRVAPSASLKAGYDNRAGKFGQGGHATEHTVTIGVELSRALSRTRRATMRLDVSPSRLEMRGVAVEGLAEPGNHRLNRLSGEAQLSVPFRPNWQTRATYRRGVEYLTVLNQPVLTDGGSVALTGLLTRRLDLTVSGGYADAASALAHSADPLQTYTGQVSLRFALKRSIALTSEYLYYYYDLGGQTSFSPGLPTIFEQHGGRIGVVLFLEALGR